MIGSCGPGSGGGLVATVLVSLAVLFAVFGSLTVLETVTVLVCGIGGGEAGPVELAATGAVPPRAGGARGEGEVRARAKLGQVPLGGGGGPPAEPPGQASARGWPVAAEGGVVEMGMV